MIHDSLKNYSKYPYSAIWKEAFSFIDSLNEKSEEKRYELDHGMFAIVMSYSTKERDENTILESHETYVDIQVTLEGSEVIEYFYRDYLQIKTPYNDTTDAQFYHYPDGPKAIIENQVGFFTALWPEDAHMTQLRSKGYERVKKVVVKVPLKLLSL